MPSLTELLCELGLADRLVGRTGFCIHPQETLKHPLAPEDNLALYRQIGAAFGKESEAEALCARFESAFRTARRPAFPERKVLYLIWKDPWM